MASLARRHELALAVAAGALLITFRSIVLTFFEQAYFDADQAVMGLIAKHISEGRAFPVFVYGYDYILLVESWLTAPFVSLIGVSVTAVKLPLLLLNVLVGTLLIVLLVREVHIRPAAALLASLFVVFPSPSTSAGLLEALGGNIEVFVYVLLLWVTRRRPVWFGVVLAVGFLNREFTIYGLVALIIVAGVDGTRLNRTTLKHAIVALVAFALVWDLVRVLKQYADITGPGTAGGAAALERPTNVDVVVSFVCWTWDLVIGNLRLLVTQQLPSLFGAAAETLRSRRLNSTASGGLPGLWLLLCAALLAAVVRVGWVARASRERPRGWQFCTYLVLVGAQAALVCAMTRCEPLGYGHMRYMLLALLPAVGIVALYLGTERLRLLAAAMIGTVLVWAGVNLRAHVALLTEYTRRPPLGNYRTVATYLESHGIRYARADYWAAYHITFLSDERVIVAADSPKRIDEYERVVSAHEDSAVRISRSPCPGGTEVGTLYICAPGS